MDAIIGDIWAFLADGANRETLTWIGGGVAVVAGTLWKVVSFFAKPKAKPAAPTPLQATAESGGVAVAGPVTGSTIVTGAQDAGRRP
jgi:hypothetical protein